MVFWQMPHFYAIAIRRLSDYKAAGLPMLPIKKGIRQTKIQIIAYIFAFAISIVALTAYGYAGVSFLVVMLVASAIWLYEGQKGFKAGDNILWARNLFLYSLAVLLCLSLTLSLNSFFI